MPFAVVQLKRKHKLITEYSAMLDKSTEIREIMQHQPLSAFTCTMSGLTKAIGADQVCGCNDNHIIFIRCVYMIR